MIKENIAAIYALSPMQQGMLFHSLYSPQSGVYFQQLCCVLEGDLNLSAFEHAWQQVIDRHPTLRTGFVWKNLEKPVQVAHHRIELPLERLDWQDLSADEQQQRLDAFLSADQQRGFDLSKAPLMRLTLVRLDARTHHFIWSHHHLLLDGWSVPLLLKEVFTFYEAARLNRPLSLPVPRPYRDYIGWLKKQDLTQAEQYWRETLRGFTVPTRLDIGRPAAAGGMSRALPRAMDSILSSRCG